ncbi:MAG: sigma-70 family RNA polymerase sigma factor [Pseudomonadota bacterium]
MTTTLQRIAAGNRAAVSECIDTYSGLVWSLARRFLPNEADAEEAVQEIFVTLWEQAARFDPNKAGEATFVSMLARRRLIDRRRKLDREPMAEPLDELSASLGAEGQRVLEASAETQRVVDVLKTLKPEQQEVINMSSWLGMSHGAIARETGIPLGTVKSYMSRGLKTIRAALGEPARAGRKAT